MNARLQLCQKELLRDSKQTKGSHMSAKVSKPTDAPRRDSAEAGRLFFLDVASGRIMGLAWGPQGAHDCVHALDGGNRPRARSQG